MCNEYMCISHCVCMCVCSHRNCFLFAFYRKGRVCEFNFTYYFVVVWYGINCSWFFSSSCFLLNCQNCERKEKLTKQEGVCICVCGFFRMHDQWMNKSISLARHLMQNEILFLFFFSSISICWVCMSVCMSICCCFF